MNRNSLQLLRPMLLVFIFLNVFLITARQLIVKKGADQEVLVVGNLLLFVVSVVTFLITYRSLQSSNPNSFVRAMYGGFIIEESPVSDLYSNPEHPYTIGLLGSIPRLDQKESKKLYSIEGAPPVLYEKPHHCPFAPRCKWAMERCWKENPMLETVRPEHKVACWVAQAGGIHA